MSHARNFDKTEYLVRDVADWSQTGFVFDKVTEAYDFWKEDTKREAFEFNLGEGTCRDLTEDFRDWTVEDEREARSWRRHERSYARAL